MPVAWSEDGYGDAGFGGVTAASATIITSEISGVVGSASTLTETFVDLTGVSAAAELGESQGVEDNVWGGSTWGTPAGWGGIVSAEVFIQTVEITGVVGSVSTLSETFVFPTGLSATGAVGESEPVEDNVWGGSTWGTPEGWGGVLSAEAFIATVAITGVVGTVATKTENFISLTGVSGAGEIGTASVAAAANFSIFGVSATGELGEAEGLAGAKAYPDGVVATASVSSVGTASGAVITPSGLQAVVDLGEEEIDAKATVSTTGVSSVGTIGTAIIRGTSVVDVTGVLGATALGEVDAQADTNAYVTGVVASGSVGSVTNTGNAFVYLTGVQGVGRVARPLVWGLIDTSQSPNWVPIAA